MVKDSPVCHGMGWDDPFPICITGRTRPPERVTFKGIKPYEVSLCKVIDNSHCSFPRDTNRFHVCMISPGLGFRYLSQCDVTVSMSMQSENHILCEAQ